MLMNKLCLDFYGLVAPFVRPGAQQSPAAYQQVTLLKAN